MNPSESERARLLIESKNIAVVGLSDNPERTSYQIANAMQQAGYRIFPVNPNLKQLVLGETPYSSLLDIEDPVDIVNIFRRSETVLPIVEDAVKVGAEAVWMQQGVINEEAARLAREYGMMVIMDQCIKVDHVQLLSKA